MKSWLSELSINLKTVVLSSIAILVIYLCLIFGYFVNLKDIPNGFLLGGIVGIASFLLMALADKLDNKKDKPTFAIIFIVIRFILIGAIIILVALMNYQWNINIFNIFTVVGGYFVPLIINIIIYVMERKNV